MIRDPFYRDIIEGLEGHLDATVFEDCALDLLREPIPTLVPIRGGTDRGMDGGIADGHGLPFPLVCTTRMDVNRSLRGSLRMYKQKGGKRRRVVFATSRVLTPTARFNLEKIAKELGFTLLQTYDQTAIANLLFRSPTWCKDLLGLTGAPPPLSVLPATKRLLGDQPLIGREADLQWLRQTKGDLVLSGQPGSGKTFLMYLLAKEDEGLFVVTPDKTAIANAIRSQRPTALLVDDAHFQPDLLPMLRQLRQELGAEFRIIANCWPGKEESIGAQLSVPSASIRKLERLSQDEIVDVLKGCGLIGPDELLHHLVRQAEGLPGLAVTLAHLCLRGDVQEVAFGDALARDIKTTFQRLVGDRATTVLAAFAIGGKIGMDLEDVREYLGLSRPDLYAIVSQLSAGGVIHQREKTLNIRPAALRSALVRDVFFASKTPLDSTDLIAQAPYLTDAILTIVAARHCDRSNSISDRYLQQLLEQTSMPEPWRDFAWLGREQCRWVLDHHPDMSTAIVSPALRHYPEGIIPILLTRAVGDERPLNAHPDHSLRQLEGWVEDVRPDSEEVVRTRKALFDAAIAWHDAGGDETITLRALAISLSSGFSFTRSDPGSGNKITFASGSLSAEDIKKVQSKWPRILEFLEKKQPKNWNPILSMIDEYIRRLHAISNSTREASAAMTSKGWEMLEDVVGIADGRQGVLHWAVTEGKRLKRKVDAKLDPEFAILYPTNENRMPSDSLAQQEFSHAKELAAKWAKQEPSAVAEKYAGFQADAELYNCWPRYGETVFALIADQITNPSVWLSELRKKNISGDISYHFLKRSFALGEPNAKQEIINALEGPERNAALHIVMTMKEPPEDVLKIALSKLDGMERMVEFWAMKKAIPEPQMKLLLQHPDDAIASSAAVGEWYTGEEHGARPSLEKDWRDAIVRAGGRHHQLHDIFSERHDVAQMWLERFLKAEDHLDFADRETARDAIMCLESDQKAQLLRSLPSDAWWLDDVVSELVGRNTDLYKVVLETPALKRYRLAPLRGHPAGTWIEMAKMAVDAGYEVGRVVSATRSGGMSWSGDESVMWQSWIDDFDALRSHPDPVVKDMGELGSKHVRAYQDDALRREKQEKIYGI